MNVRNISQLTTFSALVHELRYRAEERAKAAHLNFNVFTTVLQAHDEVRLHTRFIHNLLDPQGTHDCGDLFLQLFFKVLDDAPCDLGKSSYLVRKEASTDQGQIDLLLEAPDFGIAIENKIYAAEQHRQLARYADYLQSVYDKNWLLLYLTLDGRQPLSHGDADYICISYRDHILVWLERCLAATFSFIPINQILLQYRQVVRQLTGETLEGHAMKNIADHLIANPELIRMRSAYNAGVEEVKKTALDLLAQSFIAELAPHFPATLRANMTEGRFGADAWGSIRLHPETGPFAATRYQLTIEHLQKWNALVIGIESKWNVPSLTAVETQILTKLNELLAIELTDNGIHKADPQKTWHGEYWPVGWHDLVQGWVITDEVILDLLDENRRTAIAKDFITKALIQIKLLERLHEEATKITSSPSDL